MEDTASRSVVWSRQHKGAYAFVWSLLACFLVVVAYDCLAMSPERNQSKNILVRYSFSDRGLFDPLDPVKSAQYEQDILGAIAVILLQALLIAGLLWQRARRKSASGALEKAGGLLIHAQEEERASIARELHDDFSQRLALQCIELTQLEKNLPVWEVAERARALRILTETREMSADMRSLSHQLHSSRLELVGLVLALRGLCEETTKNHKITVLFTEPEFSCDLTKDVELCLFRVAQEALANATRHSGASSAQIELGFDTNSVSLRISDAGKGFDPTLKTAGRGIGLISMRERLRLLDGELSVRSDLMRGTEILAQIPLPASANEAWGKIHVA